MRTYRAFGRVKESVRFGRVTAKRRTRIAFNCSAVCAAVVPGLR
jgi:hypothetical protein